MSLTIYKLTDRIEVKIGGVTFKVAPLSYAHRTHILSFVQQDKLTEIQRNAQMALHCVKYGVKEISGVKTACGKPYELEFDDEGNLTDGCTSEVLSLETQSQLIQALAKLLNEMKDPGIDGVEVVLPGAKKNVKKKTPSTG